LTEATPDHSTLSRTRRLIDLETHEQVFAWVLTLLADRGLLQGKRIGIDATTLEANAAMKSIVRRDTGESYNEFLTGLAKESGIETPTREDLMRLDRKREKRNWNGKQSEQQTVEENQRRVTGEYGKQLLRRRGELVERTHSRNRRAPSPQSSCGSVDQVIAQIMVFHSI
jgi:hypothetical protein